MPHATQTLVVIRDEVVTIWTTAGIRYVQTKHGHIIDHDEAQIGDEVEFLETRAVALNLEHRNAQQVRS